MNVFGITLIIALLHVFAACGVSEPNEFSDSSVKDRNPSEHHCSDAYEELKSLHQAIEGLTQESKPIINQPAFMERCQTWPTQSTQCLKVGFHFENKETCDDALQKIPESDRKALRKLLNLTVTP